MTAVVVIVLLVLGLLVSIALHEIGHLVPAKRFGVRVTQYMVGFGPTLWSRRRGETEYGLKAVPLGGYIRMVGMFPPAPEGARPPRGFFGQVVADARDASVEEIRPGEEHRAFYHLSAPKKAVVMLGGPFMNLLLAFVLFVVVFAGIGVHTATTTVGEVAACVPAAVTAPAADDEERHGCADGDPASPAAVAGIEPGDRIVAFDGRPVETWTDFAALAASASPGAVPVVVERAGEEVALTVRTVEIERQAVGPDGAPQVDGAGAPVLETVGYVGVVPTAERRSAGIGTATSTFGETLRGTAGIVLTLPARLYDAGHALVTGSERGADSVLSIYGVGQVTVTVAQQQTDLVDQAAWILQILALLNIALFVFNLIPLLPLDGGHVLNAAYEGAKRTVARLRGLPLPGPADVARMMPVAYVMFFVLIGMGVLLIVTDVVNPVSLG